MTNRAYSSFSLKKEAHDQQLAPKFKKVDLKTKVKKKSKNYMVKNLSLFRQYGRLEILDKDQKIKISKKKLKEYIKGKINALKTTNIFKDLD